MWIFWDSFKALVVSHVSRIPYVGDIGILQDTGTVLVALLAGYMLVILTISVATSLFGEKIIVSLAKKRYPSISIEARGKFHKSLYYTFKASAIFVLLFLLLLPALFVPILGQIVALLLWAILLKEPTLYDVSSALGREHGDFGGARAWMAALLAASFNYIPFLNIFAPVFAQILFMHYLLDKEDRARRSR